jgi:hypothetical protein
VALLSSSDSYLGLLAHENAIGIMLSANKLILQNKHALKEGNGTAVVYVIIHRYAKDYVTRSQICSCSKKVNMIRGHIIHYNFYYEETSDSEHTY